MFGISGTELLIVAVFAFIIFGPDKIPEIARTVSKAINMFKRTQEDMERMVKAEMYGLDPDKNSMFAPADKARPGRDCGKAPRSRRRHRRCTESSTRKRRTRSSSSLTYADTPNRMPFFDHIAELRRRIVVIAVTLLVAGDGALHWGWQIYYFVMAPVLPLLDLKPQVFTPFGTFGLRFQVAFYAAIVVGSPIIIWQFMAFFLPALKAKERRYVVPTFATAAVLFLAGVAFCYTIILGPAFSWIIAQGGDAVGVTPDAQKFFQGVVMLLIGFGVGFELPVVVFYLVIFNIVPYEKLRQQWRVVYVVLMLVASAATPDWSPLTMGGLYAALVLLYEGSMLFARVVLRKRIAAQKREEIELYGGDDSTTTTVPRPSAPRM